MKSGKKFVRNFNGNLSQPFKHLSNHNKDKFLNTYNVFE